MELSFVFILYVIIGISSLFTNSPTFGKAVGKLFFLIGMLFVGGVIFLFFVDDAPMIGTPISISILGFALWRAYKW